MASLDTTDAEQTGTGIVKVVLAVEATLCGHGLGVAFSWCHEELALLPTCPFEAEAAGGGSWFSMSEVKSISQTSWTRGAVFGFFVVQVSGHPILALLDFCFPLACNNGTVHKKLTKFAKVTRRKRLLMSKSAWSTQIASKIGVYHHCFKVLNVNANW